MNHEISVQMCKKNARVALYVYRLRLPLFLLFSVLIFAFLGIAYFVRELCFLLFLLPWATVGSIAITLLLAIFLLSPLWRGLLVYPVYAQMCGKCDLRMLFFFFSHKQRYFYAVRRGLGCVFRAILFFSVFYAIAVLGGLVGRDMMALNRNAVALLVFLLSVTFLVLLIFAFSRWRTDLFLLDHIFLSAPLLTTRQAKTLSARKMRGGGTALRRLNRAFLPFWVLSVLGLGIPLVFFVPYYIAVRGQLAMYMMKV